MIEFGFGVMAGRKVEALETKTELPPRKAQAEETRRRILEAAVEAFSAQLYDEVSVGDIATSAITLNAMHVDVLVVRHPESGAVKLHLGVEADFRPAKKAHPALLVDDLSALVAVLEAERVGVTPDDPVEGRNRCFVSDPFGNRIELIQG